MLYYKLLGKRDRPYGAQCERRAGGIPRDTRFNRLTLRIQYRLADHIFVHTEKMKLELIEEFGVRRSPSHRHPVRDQQCCSEHDVSHRSEAKQRLGIRDGEKTILFFGRITPYKGLEYLITAFRQILAQCDDYSVDHRWQARDRARATGTQSENRSKKTCRRGRILLRSEFIPDDQTEVYFKAADVLVLPYRHIYQSGVLFLGHSFGLPVLAADVGSLRDEIVEGKNGFVFRPEDPVDLATTIERYFASDLFANLSSRRQEIRDYATERHSWDAVGQMTMSVYATLFRNNAQGGLADRDTPSVSLSD